MNNGNKVFGIEKKTPYWFIYLILGGWGQDGGMLVEINYYDAKLILKYNGF